MGYEKFDIIVMNLVEFEKASKFNDKFTIDDSIKYFKWPARYGGTFEFRYVLVIEKSTKKIVGISELQVNPYDERVVWLKFIEVAANYRHNGLSKLMISEIVGIMTSNFGENRSMIISDYSKIGEICIKNNLSNSLSASKIIWKMA